MGFQSEGLKQINGFDCAFPVNAGQVVQGSIPYPESFPLGTGSTEFFNFNFIGIPLTIKSNLVDEKYAPLVFGEEVVGEQQKSTLTYPKSIEKIRSPFDDL